LISAFGDDSKTTVGTDAAVDFVTGNKTRPKRIADKPILYRE